MKSSGKDFWEIKEPNLLNSYYAISAFEEFICISRVTPLSAFK